MWKRAQFEKKAIPDRGTSHREGPILFSDRVRTWYQNSHHERPSEVIVDPGRTMIEQKAPKDKQSEQCQGYNAKQL